MSRNQKLGFTGLLVGGSLAGWRLSPGYLRSGTRGFAYGLGLRHQQLDGLGRVVAGMLSHADHPPCVVQMGEHAQYVTGIEPREYFLKDGRKMVTAFKQVADWYGMDMPVPFADSYNFEDEALGARMVYSDIGMPTIDSTDPLIKNPCDLDGIAVDFTLESGRLRYNIDATNAYKDVCGLPKMIIFCAPFSLAVGLRTYPKLIWDMRKDPKFAHELFTWITDEVHQRFFELMVRETGAHLALAGDAWAAFPNLTLEMIEEWVVPYNARLRANLLRKGILPLFIGAGDYCEEHPERFDRATLERSWRVMQRTNLGKRASRGMPVMLMGRTQDMPLEWLRDFAVDTRHAFLGIKPTIIGINARFLREGPATAIVDFIKRCIDELGRGGRLIFLFPQIAAATPPEHVHAAVAAMKTYGRYPIASDLNSVRFEMPEFEPFEKWLSKQ